MKSNFLPKSRYEEMYIVEEYPLKTKLAPVHSKKSESPVAVKAAETLRRLLQPSLPFPNNKKMASDFGNVITKWMKCQTWKATQPAVNLPFIHTFAFNEKIPLYQCWRLKVSITRKRNDLLELHIPSFIPREIMWAPGGTTSIECIISIASCTLQTGTANGSVIYPFTVPYHNNEIASQSAEISIPTPEGSLIIGAASLNYIVSENGNLIHRSEEECLPAGVIASMYI
ncbi:hypothetical protein BH20BAC1_BH20BAC1_21830 [soil metagenome]